MSVNNTLAERGSRYGKFADHAKIAQGLQDTMRAAPNWNNLDYDMKQALSVIADKIARILNGDPFYADNWHDLQGYAKLIEDRVNMIVEEEDSLYASVDEAEVEETRAYKQEIDDTVIFHDGTNTYNTIGTNTSLEGYGGHYGH